MDKKVKFLILIIVILGLLVVGMGSYIVYDKIINKDIDGNNNINVENNDLNNDEDNNLFVEQENLLSNDLAKVIVKELEEKYYEYARVKNLEVYCGETDSTDYISFGSYETNDFRDYWASKSFNSIEELKTYFNDLMIDALKPNTFDNGISYIEKDGKLYCQLSHKGLGGDRDYKKESEYSVVSIKDDMIISDVSFWAFYMGEIDSVKRDVTITIVLDNDGKWLVSDYEFKN